MKTQITLDQVECVYVGKNGTCCCGCSGKYSYPTSALGTNANRGYEVTADEISDRAVIRGMNKINKAIMKGDVDFYDSEYVAITNDADTRITIVYFKKKD